MKNGTEILCRLFVEKPIFKAIPRKMFLAFYGVNDNRAYKNFV